LASAPETTTRLTARSMHSVGVICGLAAGVWLGGAEAPTKLVTAGFSPFAVSFCMVLGVFTARWTLPTLLKGTNYVFADLVAKPHLVIWAILAGALWSVANTLTVFAIRDVGLAIAFPLWNANCLIGMFWGWRLFNEMRGSSAKDWIRVVGGAVAIVIAAIMLALVTVHHGAIANPRAVPGILAALGASLLWGTMYVPYRKAYLSGMNPLSFVTVFTIGELLTMALLAMTMHGGLSSFTSELKVMRPAIFWLFLGGFFWVIGDLFQQYATKYIGIGRGIPLSNTNQLWGLAWGALVFGELKGLSHGSQFLILAASLIMILGALVISSSVAPARERQSCNDAIDRECRRYGLNLEECIASQSGNVHGSEANKGRPWWDFVIVLLALAVFLWLAIGTTVPPLAMHYMWTAVLGIILVAVLLGCGWMLWKRTRFS
jgi:glucose uptake protein GlcU